MGGCLLFTFFRNVYIDFLPPPYYYIYTALNTQLQGSCCCCCIGFFLFVGYIKRDVTRIGESCSCFVGFEFLNYIAAPSCNYPK